MEKRKWLFKRKPSEKCSGETESSGSASSHSEKCSDDQMAFKQSPTTYDTQSPDVTSKSMEVDGDVYEKVRVLTEKLSAALVNVSAKDDLVKQHVKVAEEAVAGWEKAEDEAADLRKQLEVAAQQNSALADQVSQLDGALKECVRQLRLIKEEQEQKIQENVLKKTQELESVKCELENQLIELQHKAELPKFDLQPQVDPGLRLKLDSLARENSTLKLELKALSEELEVSTIERDLSTQAAEVASKQHLESIKKLAKLEAECRRLRVSVNKSIVSSDNKSATASSTYVESLTDSQSDSGERLSTTDIDSFKYEPGTSDSWASALIAELDQFKNGKVISRSNVPSYVEMDLMDDFLEMERLAAQPQTKSGGNGNDLGDVAKHKAEKALKAELEAMTQRAAELEEKLKKVEAERSELQMALTKSNGVIETAQLQLKEAEKKLDEVQRELRNVNESKQFIDSQLIGMEAEASTLSAKVDSLELEVERERATSVEIATKCQEFEEELTLIKQEAERQKAGKTSNESKIKQEDLTVSSGRLVDCQKTIASLGNQLKSLATLEDFLIDTGNLPDLSGEPVLHRTNGELRKLRSSEAISVNEDSDSQRVSLENAGPSDKNDKNSPSSSSSSSSALSSSNGSSEKNRNGFAKFFSRTKNGIQLDI